METRTLPWTVIATTIAATMPSFQTVHPWFDGMDEPVRQSVSGMLMTPLGR